MRRQRVWNAQGFVEVWPADVEFGDLVAAQQHCCCYCCCRGQGFSIDIVIVVDIDVGIVIAIVGVGFGGCWVRLQEGIRELQSRGEVAAPLL